MATVPVSGSGVAITPDGKHAYVTGSVVSVIDTATNKMVATVPVGIGPAGVAISPDGKRAYVTNQDSTTVSVIDTATNKVVATVALVISNGHLTNSPRAIAITPDGKHAYVAGRNIVFGGIVSVIDTASNTVVATVPVGAGPLSFEDLTFAVAITPDGKHAYITSLLNKRGSIGHDQVFDVIVIDTATNRVVAGVEVGNNPFGVAVTPDGKHVYVVNEGANNVSVIDTATNRVAATVTVGNGPSGVGIVPAPPGIPFLAFSAKLAIDLDREPKEDRFELQSSFTLSSTASNGIDPVAEPVTLQIGTFAITIPPGSFKKHKNGSFTLAGAMGGVSGQARITPTGTLRYAFHAKAEGADLTGTKNDVYVTLTIGDDSGATSVKADIDH